MILRNKALGLCLALTTACFAGGASAVSFVVFDPPNGAMSSAAGVDAKGDIVGSWSDGDAFSDPPYVRHKDGSYGFIFLGTDSPITALGVSPKGRVAGWLTDFQTHQKRGFFGKIAREGNTVYTKFDLPGNLQPSVTAINDKGEIAGYSWDGQNVAHSFLRTTRGKVKELKIKGSGAALNQGVEALAVAGDGRVCGIYVDADNFGHGFLRDADGNLTTFDVPDARRTTPTAFDAEGGVVGYYKDMGNVYHAFQRTSGGTITTFDAPGAGQATVFKAINSKGVGAGYMIDSAGVYHGFIRNAAGKITVFDAPDALQQSGVGTFPVGITEKNEVVGYYFDAGFITHSFIRKP